MDPEFLTPMIRTEQGDFFVFEPVALINQTICMPSRWFLHAGIMYARAWPMTVSMTDGGPGWLVCEYQSFDVPVSEIVASLPFLIGSFRQRHVPDPRRIIGRAEFLIFSFSTINERETGVVSREGEFFKPWTRTDPTRGNKWRERSQGHQVLCFPIWLYCDDTSGNSSKKWN